MLSEHVMCINCLIQDDIHKGDANTHVTLFMDSKNSSGCYKGEHSCSPLETAANSVQFSVRGMLSQVFPSHPHVSQNS